MSHRGSSPCVIVRYAEEAGVEYRWGSKKPSIPPLTRGIGFIEKASRFEIARARLTNVVAHIVPAVALDGERDDDCRQRLSWLEPLVSPTPVVA